MAETGTDVAVGRKDSEVLNPPPVVKPLDQVKDPLQDPLTNRPKEEESKERGKEGTEAGRLEYESLLGEALGSKLYGALAPHLTLGALSGYAGKAIEAAIAGGGAALIKGDNVDPAAAKGLAAEIGKLTGPLASQWVKGSGAEYAKAVGKFVDANPEVIVAAAILAAAGAVLSDMKIPELKQKFNIAKGLDAEVGAKLGSLQKIALEEIKATVKYQSDSIKASITVSDGGLESAEVKAKTDTKMGELSGGLKKEKDKSAMVQFGLQNQVDEHTTRTDSLNINAETGEAGTSSELAYKEGANTFKAITEQHGDGSTAQGFDLSTQFDKNWSGKLGAKHKESALGQDSASLAAGLQYQGEHFKFGGTGEVDGGSNYKLGVNGAYENGMNKVSAGYGFNSQNQTHSLKALGQTQLSDDLALRGTVDSQFAPKGNTTKVDADLFHKLGAGNVIYGAGAKFGPEGNSANVGLGYDFGKFAVKGTFDTNKQAGLQMVVPLGGWGKKK